jgi:hypothetical protein
MSKAPSEMRQVCMYANFEPPKNYEEMNLFASRTESSQSTSIYSKNSINKGVSSGGVARKRVSFHEDVKASKDSYYNNLEDIGETTGSQIQYNKTLPTATMQKEGHYYSNLWDTYPKIFLIISLITAGFASCLWNRTQHSAYQLLVDSNSTITNHGVSSILTIDIEKERIVENPNDFKEISLQYSSKETEDNFIQTTAEIATIKDAHVTSDLITPILNSYDNELMTLKPLLQQRVAPIYLSKNNDKQEENVPQQDSLDGRIKGKQNDRNVVPPQQENIKKERIQDTITSHQCSIKCLVTFAFLNSRANCQGCNRNNKNLSWTNALDSLFMD